MTCEPKETAGASPSRKSIAVVFAISAAFAALSAFFLFPKLAPVESIFDVNGFGRIAEGLANGEGFTDGPGLGPSIRRAPLYPLVGAATLKVFRSDAERRKDRFRPLIVLQCLFAGVWCAAVFVLGWRLFGPGPGWTAAVLVAVWPQCLRYLGSVEVEATMTLLLTLFSLAAYVFLRRPCAWNGVLLGLIVGLATLTKPIVMLLLPAFGLALFWRRVRAREALPAASLAVALAVQALVVLPWIVRNHIVTHGQYRGISANAPGEFLRGYVVARPEYFLLKREFRVNWDLAANAYEEALLKPHGYEFYDFSTGQPLPKPQTIANNLRKDQIQGPMVRERLLKEPLGFLRKFAIQLFTFWYLVETPAKSLLVGGLSLFALVLAGIGCADARIRGISVFAPVLVVVYCNLIYAVMLSFARYSMPVFPSLLVLSGNGAWVLAARLRSRVAR